MTHNTVHLFGKVYYITYLPTGQRGFEWRVAEITPDIMTPVDYGTAESMLRAEIAAHLCIVKANEA